MTIGNLQFLFFIGKKVVRSIDCRQPLKFAIGQYFMEFIELFGRLPLNY
jgi:hypothetical protein